MRKPAGGRFAPTTAGSRSLISLIQARTFSNERTAILPLSYAFSPAASAQPAADLFHFLHAGANFVFINGCQDDRATSVACTAASAFKEGLAAVPVRVIAWSSANGWRELYPETGDPIVRDPDSGETLPYDKAYRGKPVDYNDPALMEELFDDPENADPLSPMEALTTMGSYQMEDVEEGKRARVLFLANGMGPHFQDSLRGNGRLLQQLKDVRDELDRNARKSDASTTAQILFNDSAGLSPDLVKALGISYELPLPSREMLEQSAFRTIASYLVDPEAQRPPADVDAAEIAAWRKIVGDKIPEDTIREAAADGVALESFSGFMPKGKTFVELCEQLVGFTKGQAKDLIGEAVSRAGEDGRIDFNFVAERRFAMLKEDFCLTLIGPDEFRPKPVGLEQALGELPQVKAAFERGHLLNPPLLPPKLILMTGVSGQGKSLFCKEAAEQLNLPLYRLELATLFSKWVGDSERNFARLFQVLESLSPCAVWIDEIEKALGGAREGSSQTHEVTGRVHGLILTWLQEHSSRILLMATCNEPQLLSSAVVNRADTKYFVGYQDPETLADTWMSNLDAIAKGHNVTRDELLELSQLKPSMTGREVFNRIKKARAVALARTPEGDRVDVTFADLKQVLRTYRTDFEKDTGRAMAILDMSKAYESASGKPIYYPDVEEREEQSPAAAGSKSKARLARDEV